MVLVLALIAPASGVRAADLGDASPGPFEVPPVDDTWSDAARA